VDAGDRVFGGSPYEQRFGFARAVRAGGRVLVSGTAPVWPDGSCDPDPGAQARRCLEIIRGALHELGSSTADVVRTRMFVTSAEHADAVGTAHAETFGDVRPAATMVVVRALLDPRWKVEIEAEAQLAGGTDESPGVSAS
jgi:enamine deaminase RidA (YjgF/YER057c/UK114 family)